MRTVLRADWHFAQAVRLLVGALKIRTGLHGSSDWELKLLILGHYLNWIELDNLSYFAILAVCAMPSIVLQPANQKLFRRSGPLQFQMTNT